MIIAIANQKGGTNKTTTAVNLSVALAKEGQRVLALDIDPEQNLSYHLLHKELHNLSSKDGLYSVLKGEKNIEDILIDREGISLAPSSIELASLEIELISKIGRENILKNCLNGISNNWDFIIIDTPPSLSLLTINSLVASDSVIIPLQPEPLSLQGLSSLMGTIDIIKKELNPKLKLMGILLTAVQSRRNITNEIEDLLRKKFKVFKTKIGIDVKLTEASSYGKSIFAYYPNSRGANSYSQLAREILNEKI